VFIIRKSTELFSSTSILIEPLVTIGSTLMDYINDSGVRNDNQSESWNQMAGNEPRRVG
jgi:hypothetical protein